jgi:hypothetical protein
MRKDNFMKPGQLQTGYLPESGPVAYKKKTLCEEDNLAGLFSSGCYRLYRTYAATQAKSCRQLAGP